MIAGRKEPLVNLKEWLLNQEITVVLLNKLETDIKGKREKVQNGLIHTEKLPSTHNSLYDRNLSSGVVSVN